MPGGEAVGRRRHLYVHRHFDVGVVVLAAGEAGIVAGAGVDRDALNVGSRNAGAVAEGEDVLVDIAAREFDDGDHARAGRAARPRIGLAKIGQIPTPPRAARRRSPRRDSDFVAQLEIRPAGRRNGGSSPLHIGVHGLGLGRRRQPDRLAANQLLLALRQIDESAVDDPRDRLDLVEIGEVVASHEDAVAHSAGRRVFRRCDLQAVGGVRGQIGVVDEVDADLAADPAIGLLAGDLQQSATAVPPAVPRRVIAELRPVSIDFVGDRFRLVGEGRADSAVGKRLGQVFIRPSTE